MPAVSQTVAQGYVSYGPLAAPTDFQVKRGAVYITGESPGGSTTYGFIRVMGETVQFGTGKTVQVRAAIGVVGSSSDGSADFHYEALA